MKCPKCGYLGFDSGDRCRNCGYDFSLVDQGGAQGGARTGRQTPSPTPGGTHFRDPHLARGARYKRASGTPAEEGVNRPLAAHPEGTPVDLPLFGGDAPVLPPPRPPLAVRRATPVPARIRPRTPPTPQPDALPLMMDEPAAEPAAASHGAAVASVQAPAAAAPRADWDMATPGRRAAAAAIDLSLVALVDLVVLHFTLTLCGLTFNDLHILPVVPMTAFLLLLNGGYLVLFTGTLGQTLGKMAAAIEVVADRQGGMDLKRAALRGAAMVPSLLPAGLGWVAGLVGDGRGLHDRLAGTRVVRVAGA